MTISKEMKKRVDDLFKNIYGFDEVKEALLFSLIGKPKMNVLMLGDPGTGKTSFLKQIDRNLDKTEYFNTREQVVDKTQRERIVEAKENEKILLLDDLEMRSIISEDPGFNDTLEHKNTISFLLTLLDSSNTIIATARPKWGRFDPYEMLSRQINIPSSIIDRFDLILIMKDIPNKDKDRLVGEKMLKKGVKDIFVLDKEELTRFLHIAEKFDTNIMAKKASDKLLDYYITLRNGKNNDEYSISSIPLSPRNLQTLLNLARLHAKARASLRSIEMKMKNTKGVIMKVGISEEDAKFAIRILHYCISQIGVDPETGELDIDRITNISESTRKKLNIMKEIFKELENEVGITMPIEEILKKTDAKKLTADEVDELIGIMKRSGDIFEPRRGFLQRI